MKHLLRRNYLLFILVFVLIACKNNQAPRKATITSTHDDTVTDQGEAFAQIAVLKDGLLHALYQHYEQLTDALVEGDVTSARISANAIEAGAREMGGGARLAQLSSRITSASDIHAQRSAFAPLSVHLQMLIKKQGLTRGRLFVDYCPMALNDQGAYWITTTEQIRNPYFGDKMLDCGSVEDTLQ